MKKISFHILRVGLAITFLWIGLLILREPEVWGGYIAPWALDLMPIPIREAMIGTGIFDVAVGIFLLIDFWVWLVALVGAGHLVIVLVVSGINEGTVRDIAILAGAFALVVDSLPKNLTEKINPWRKRGRI